MEIGFPEGTATLVCLCDGTTSLYMGRGGGILGGQACETVRTAGAKFLGLASDCLASMNKAKTFPLPGTGRVCFYVLTMSGVFAIDEDEQLLGDGKHRLSHLFYAGHDVIGNLRILSEQARSSR